MDSQKLAESLLGIHPGGRNLSMKEAVAVTLETSSKGLMMMLVGFILS
jgi:hypothetical protein